MKKRFIVILSISISAVSISVHLYKSNTLEQQIQVLIGPTIVFQSLTGLGSGAEFVGFLRKWYKKRNVEEKIVVLKPREVYHDADDSYFLRLGIIRDEDVVESKVTYLEILPETIRVILSDYFWTMMKE